jgi:hypothetical protein
MGELTIPQKIYLGLIMANEYPEQEPEHVAANWYHMLWFLLPIIGMLVFTEAVKFSYNRNS